jgi:hypothetical protein
MNGNFVTRKSETWKSPSACWKSFLMSGLKKGLPPGLQPCAHNIDLKPESLPFRQKKYPVQQEAHLRIQTHLQWLKDAGILINCQSSWSTLLLPVKKTGGDDYQPAQDLQAVNNAIITLHTVGP